MKKITIMLTAIAIGVIAQASTVNWKLTTGTTAGNVYAFANTASATILTACASTTAADWTAMFDGMSAIAASGASARTSVQGETNGVAANDTLTFVIVSGDIAEGSTYAVYSPVTLAAANVFDPPATGTQLSLTLSSLTSAGSGTFTAVPEPTSGLLMLLGLAGLALKRKHA